MKNKHILLELTKLLKEDGFENIKTHLEGHSEPPKLVKAGSDKGFIPDMTASLENNTHIFEIELKNSFDIDKWKLFERYTTNKGGKFIILTPAENKKEVVKAMQENAINANLILINPTNTNN